MKTFKVRGRAAEEGGEFVLGFEETGTHACYMIYGELREGDPPRLIRPGAGHEEIVMAVAGDIEVSGAHSGTLKEGEAFHIEGDGECFLRNVSGGVAIYVAAGGHSGGGH